MNYVLSNHFEKRFAAFILLIFLVVSIPTVGQDACIIESSGSIYTTKDSKPIPVYRPQIVDSEFQYETDAVKLESEIVSIPFKHLLLYVDGANEFFTVFDKKTAYCSIGSEFMKNTDEGNFVALTKDNRLIRKFINGTYINAPTQRYSLYNDHLIESPWETLAADDIVLFVGHLKWGGQRINVNATPSEIEKYLPEIISILTTARVTNESQVESIETTSDDNEVDDARNEVKDVSEPLAEVQSEQSATEVQPAEEKSMETVEDPPSKAKEKKNKVDKKDPENTSKSEDSSPLETDTNELSESTEEIVEVEQEVDQAASEVEKSKKDKKNKSREKESDQKEAKEPSTANVRNHSENDSEPESSSEQLVSAEPVEKTTSVPPDKPLQKEDVEELARKNTGTDNSAPPVNAPTNLGKREMPVRNEISDEEKEEISRKAKIQLEKLKECFQVIVDRDISSHIKKAKRENTVKTLFVNDRKEVTVSSLNRDDFKFYVIPVYLERMENLYYKRVEIDFNEIHKVTDLKKAPDGTWTGTVTFSQVFRGYDDFDSAQPRYSDITHKNVTIVVRRVESFTGGSRPEVEWIVLLGDIGVNETGRL